jgi:hypothetical protein
MSLKPAFKTPSKEVRIQEEVGIKTFATEVGMDESTFEGSELFSGTQGAQLARMGDEL